MDWTRLRKERQTAARRRGSSVPETIGMENREVLQNVGVDLASPTFRITLAPKKFEKYFQYPSRPHRPGSFVRMLAFALCNATAALKAAAPRTSPSPRFAARGFVPPHRFERSSPTHRRILRVTRYYIFGRDSAAADASHSASGMVLEASH